MNDWRGALKPYLPQQVCHGLDALRAEETVRVREVRLRAWRDAVVCGDGITSLDARVSASEITQTLAAMLGQALHAHGRELSEGFVTLPGGHRAGFCGRMAQGSVAEAGSIAIRIAREKPGAAEGLRPWLFCGERPQSLLIVSPPGMGKTTMLRDAARMLSQAGVQVGIADERSEIAACRAGVPQLDVGANTDVIDGCPKAEGMRLLLRAMAPQAIVTDEIGGRTDAACVGEMTRCGVAVLASAHGKGYEDAAARLEGVMAAFDAVIVLDGLARIGGVYGAKGERLA